MKKGKLPNLSLISFPNKLLPFEIVCLVLVGIFVYGGTLDHSFHFDDIRNISGNHHIQISKLTPKELYSAAFESPVPTRPLANITFALNYYFHGLDVTGYHVVNILIHLFSSVFLFFFVKTTMGLPLVREKCGEPGFIPFFTALIWLIHPLQTQSVTYIVQRMNSMGAMFFIMAMLFYAKARITPHISQKTLFVSISVIAGFLALGSKENTMTLPIYILLYEWYFFQDLSLKIPWKQLLGTVLAILVPIVLFYLFFNDVSLNELISNYDKRPFSLVQRILTEWRVIVLYVSLILYPNPDHLNVDYDFPLSYSLISPATTLFSLFILLGLLVGAICLARKYRLYSFCILWFLGNLVIESSILPLEIVYEHRTYLPSMLGILLLIILFARVVKRKEVLVACLVSVSVVFSFWTYERNKVWQDDFTPWSDCHKKSPNKTRVNQNLGAIIGKRAPEKAIPYFHKALDLYMRDIKYQRIVDNQKTSFHLSNLGNAYRLSGAYQKAIHYYKAAQQQFYYDVDLHFQLGYCYLQIGDGQKAVQHFSKALQFAKHRQTSRNIQTD